MAKHARISCPACQTTLRVRPEYVGQTVACKLCDATFEVPALDAPGADEGTTPDAIIRKLLARLESRERRYETRKRLLAEAEARVVELSAEVDDLRARIEAAEALAGGLSEAREEAGRLSDELAAVVSERDLLRGSSEARARELSDELAAARDELIGLRRGAEEEGRVAGELAELRGRLEASEALQIEAARGRDALAEELGVARAEAGRLAEELERLGADREQLQSRWEGRERELAEELARAESQIRGLVAAQGELDRVRQEAEERGRELAEERAAAERTREDLQGRLAEAEGFADALRAELARVRDASAEELHGARADAARLSVELVATRADRDLLRESLERRAGELGEARALIRGHAEEFAAARREAEGLRRELAAHAEQRAREAREQPEAGRQGLGVDIEAFRADLEQMRQELVGSLGGRDATLRLIESLAEERQQVTALRDQLKSTFRDGEAVYQAKLAQAAQAIRQGQEAHAAERKRADELAGRIVAMEAELARQRREREAERLQAHQLVLSLRQGQEAPPTGPAPAEPGRGPRMVTLAGKPAVPAWGRVVLPAGGDGPDGGLPMDHRDLALGELGPLAAFHK